MPPACATQRRLSRFAAAGWPGMVRAGQERLPYSEPPRPALATVMRTRAAGSRSQVRSVTA